MWLLLSKLKFNLQYFHGELLSVGPMEHIIMLQNRLIWLAEYMRHDTVIETIRVNISPESFLFRMTGEDI